MARKVVEPSGGPSPAVIDSFRRAVIALEGIGLGQWDENSQCQDLDTCHHCGEYTMHEYTREPVTMLEYIPLSSGKTIRIHVIDVTYRCLACNGRGKR